MGGGDTASLNVRWAALLVRSFAARGLEHAVISPGSRSTPLVLALEAAPSIRTHVCVDERSAAFFALGLARGTGRPAALVCTSGSAPAHWYPAVIEASETGVPLILLSADRPPELHDCGANQTVDQTRLFGSHVRAFHGLSVPDEDMRHLPGLAARAMDQACWTRPGPVHLNLPFREPLVPHRLPDLPEPALVPEPMHPAATVFPGAAELATRLAGRPGVIVCGAREQDADYPGAVAELAAVLRVPVLADPLSGLRFGRHDRSHVMTRYDAYLRAQGFAEGRERPEWVLQLGGPPVSKALAQWLGGDAPGDFIVADAEGRWPDPLRHATRVVRAPASALCRVLADEAPAPAPSGWLERFRRAEDRAAELVAIARPPEASVVHAVLDALPLGGRLFLGNSMPVREVDAFGGTGEKPIRLIGNRGASGIDGNVSTVLGLAASGEEPVIGLIGDLAFFHDLTGLAAARSMKGNAVFVVIDNGGGGIFEYLPQAQLPGFAQHWLTPTGLDLGRVGDLFGLRHREIDVHEQLHDALIEALATPGVDLLIVSVDRNESVARHRAYWAAVDESL